MRGPFGHGAWLYHGQTVDQIAAQNGWSYVFWACDGFHFLGDWSPGQPYELRVKQILANQTWESPNFWRFHIRGVG